MKYNVIFTTGHSYDDDYTEKGLRGDVLIQVNNNVYYCFEFIEIERLINEFSRKKICYIGLNQVILKEVTTKTILNSIEEIHNMQFTKLWLPLTEDQLVNSFYPKENWVSYEVMYQTD